ncbi:MAG TPA: type II toxin-antitoxin system prevent-host-death family antitoxin [Xanthomonadaceae bacterium]|jgi:prevent-host-death family protein|nr:type II toxin-antitoxin system prevent-host-death family antitoxin [Xanthomonadaceae bacterium]
MGTVNIREAKPHLSRLVEQVAAGQDILIAKAGKPMAKLVPLQGVKPEIRFGLLKQTIRVPEDFDAPLTGHARRALGDDGPFPFESRRTRDTGRR